jgi:hypothetical protein
VNLIDIFEKFAEDFEGAVADNNWLRLEKFFAENATYLNHGGPDPKCEGREAILTYFEEDVTNTDRRFDTRTLIALSPPSVNGARLSRRWRCTYTLNDAPDLVLEGESRYVFESDLIEALEVHLTEHSMQTLDKWMRENGDKLRN